MKVMELINSILGLTFTILYAYKFFMGAIGLFFKKKFPEAKQDHTYGVLIAGRNEEKVIGQLINSIQTQNYDKSKLRIFMVADNCTDSTASVARAAAEKYPEVECVVYERFNKEVVGKGYALDFLLENIKRDYPEYIPDAFMIFDADNLLDKNYIYEINKAFDNGARIITSYRHSKNLTTNWVSATTGMSFLRECRFLHTPRALLNTSTFVSGTGFTISSQILNVDTGWKYTALTEDIEFSINNIARGEKITYCDDAIFYDEQPITFKGSWNQRMRWQKGFYQCFKGYFGKLFKTIFSKNGFASYEMLLYIFPFVPITIIWNVIYLTYAAVYSFTADIAPGTTLPIVSIAIGLLIGLAVTYLSIFAYGMLILISERKRAKTTFWQKIGFSLMFPVFMLSYFPISIVALFKKVKWKQIPHVDSRTVEDIDAENNKNKSAQ